MGKVTTRAGFRCFYCESRNVGKRGFQNERQRLKCRDCGREFYENPDPARTGRVPVQSGFRCYHCGSDETARAGFSKFGRQKKQRFFCRGCRRYFREHPVYIEGQTEKRNSWLRKKLPSAGHLILELQVIAQDVLQRTPQTSDITELSKQGRANSLNTYRAVFGTFREALRRARLTPDYPRKYDRELMLAQLRALRKKLKRPLLKREVVAAWRKDEAPSLHFMRREFGSFTKALAAAGAGRKKYSRDEMIKCLQKLGAKLGRPIRNQDVTDLFRAGKGPSIKAIKREFGGIEKANRAVGKIPRKS